nr:hypothetical protein [uncultured Allomuricauda sp.]
MQKKLFLAREFTLEKGFLRIRFRNLTSSEEFNIPYEEIDFSKTVWQKETDNVMLIVTLVFGAFFLINIFNADNYADRSGLIGVSIFLFIVTCLSGLITYIKSKNVLLIPTHNNGYLEFIKNKPNKDEFEAFIKKLSDEIALFLKSKYAKIDLEMPVEPQLMTLGWLREKDIISEEEFENLKHNLINKKQSGASIGFSK